VYPGFHIPTLNGKSKREIGKRWPGVDLRGDGGYALFSGTTERGSYQWLRDPAEPPDTFTVMPGEFWRLVRNLPTEEPDAEPPPHVHKNKHSAAPKKPNGRDHRPDSEQLVRDALDRVSSEGRNNAGFWLSCQLRDHDYSEFEAHGIMRTFAGHCPSTDTKGHEDPYTQAEIKKTIRSAYSRSPRRPLESRRGSAKPGHQTCNRQPTPAASSHPQGEQQTEEPPRSAEDWSTLEPDTTPDLLHFMKNDAGNGERLLALRKYDLRYCAAFKKWLVWDGRRWAIDESHQAQNIAKLTLLEYLCQAVAARDEGSETFATSCLNLKRTENMLAMVRHEFYVSPKELDADPWLLNFQNGTVDLRTGELRPHRREDFITRLIHYDYRPDAPCIGWLEFLERIMGGGPQADEAAQKRGGQFIAYLQRALGYSLTGVTSEKAVFIPFGDGNNGKSTLLTVFRQLSGEYATLLQVDTLMTRRESNNTQADLADLCGTRFVQTSEAEEGQRLAQGKFKRITQGMGTIKAVRKYENPFEFSETHKLWIDTNRKPIIRDADDRATFNRLHLIPFTVQIPNDEIDKDLPKKLVSEAEGILAWAVEGTRLWCESGLIQPKEVDDAKEAYRAAMDQIGRFIEECCRMSLGSSIAASELYSAYKRWCENSGEHYESSTSFGLRLRNHGTEKKTESTGIRYQGIELKNEDSRSSC
jgi:putative DNA primase/helicase